jgi:hypothetical protein
MSELPSLVEAEVGLSRVTGFGAGGATGVGFTAGSAGATGSAEAAGSAGAAGFAGTDGSASEAR